MCCLPSIFYLFITEDNLQNWQKKYFYKIYGTLSARALDLLFIMNYRLIFVIEAWDQKKKDWSSLSHDFICVGMLSCNRDLFYKLLEKITTNFNAGSQLKSNKRHKETRNNSKKGDCWFINSSQENEIDKTIKLRHRWNTIT